MLLSDWLSLAAITVSIFTFAFVVIDSRKRPSIEIFSFYFDFKSTGDSFLNMEMVISNNSSSPVSIFNILMISPENKELFCSKFPSSVGFDKSYIERFSDELPLNIPAKMSKTSVLHFDASEDYKFSLVPTDVFKFKVFSSNGKANYKVTNFMNLYDANKSIIAQRIALRNSDR